MKDVIATLVIMLFCIAASAQKSGSAYETTPPKPKAKPLKQSNQKEKTEAKGANSLQFTSPVSLQVLAGSQGIGADVKYGFLPKLSGRLGFGIIPVDAGKSTAFTTLPIRGQLSTRFSNIHLLADYSPFKSRLFRIVGGAAYLIQGNVNVLVMPAGGYTIGSRSIAANQIGVINSDVTWRGIAPYLGFALFRSFPAKLFNINLDVGSYYLSSPGTSFTGTKLLSDNDADARQFHQNMQGYRWLPVIQLNFNFRIK